MEQAIILQSVIVGAFVYFAANLTNRIAYPSAMVDLSTLPLNRKLIDPSWKEDAVVVTQQKVEQNESEPSVPKSIANELSKAVSGYWGYVTPRTPGVAFGQDPLFRGRNARDVLRVNIDP